MKANLLASSGERKRYETQVQRIPILRLYDIQNVPAGRKFGNFQRWASPRQTTKTIVLSIHHRRSHAQIMHEIYTSFGKSMAGAKARWLSPDRNVDSATDPTEWTSLLTPSQNFVRTPTMCWTSSFPANHHLHKFQYLSTRTWTKWCWMGRRERRKWNG